MTKASLMKGGKKRSMRWKVDMDCVRVTFLSAKTAAQKLWNPHWLSHSWPVWYTAYSRCRLHSVTMGFLYKLLPCYGLCDCPSPRSIYLNGGYSNISLKQILLHIDIEIKGGIKYLALPAFKINFRAISALASSSPITIQTTSVLIFRRKTLFC